MSIPTSTSGRKSRAANRLSPNLWGRDIPLLLEQLEVRTAPSASIPLNGFDWTSIGPGPIHGRPGWPNTSSPGNLPSTGRINDIATHPLEQPAGPLAPQNYARALYTPDPNVYYVASPGGGVAKTLDGGIIWEHLTDRLRNDELGLPANATIDESVSRRTMAMNSVAVSPVNPNVVYVGEGEEGRGNGHGLLKSVNGGADWTLIRGPATTIPTWNFVTDTPGPNLVKPAAFDNVSINKIIVLRDPANQGRDLVYAMVRQQSYNGEGGPVPSGHIPVLLPELWRSRDGGTTWERITGWLTTSQTNGGTGIGYDKSFVGSGFTETPTPLTIGGYVPFTDFNVDPTNPNVVYVSVGAVRPGLTTSYSLNGIYKTENALAVAPDANTKWVVAFGGNGTFIPGSKLGRIEFGVAPSRPSVLYAAVGKGTEEGLLGVWRSQDSGVTWFQYPDTKVPNFLAAQNAYNMALAIDPTDHQKLFLGGNDFSSGNGPPSNRIVYAADAWNPDIFAVGWASIAHDSQQAGAEGPHEDIHTFDFDAAGRFLTGSDGGLFRTPTPTGTGGKYTVDWESANGIPGYKFDLNGKQIPTALNVVQVQAIGLHPHSADIMMAGTQDNGLNMFRDEADSAAPEKAYGWPMVNGGDAGNVIFDFVDPNTIYHIAPVASYGKTNYIQRSTDGGKNWTAITSGITKQDTRTPFYPVLEMDPSNRRRLFTGTDNVFETVDQGATWKPLANKELKFVTNIPSPPGSDGDPTVTAIGVGRADPNIVYAGVSNRWAQINGFWFEFGPALYRIDTRFTVSPEPAWRDRSPGRRKSDGTFETDRMEPLLPPIQKIPADNDLQTSGFVTDIAVDPFNSDIVYITSGTNIWRTDTGGQDPQTFEPNWVNIRGNLPSKLNINTVVIDPNRLAGPEDDEIYVGLDIGVWRLKNPTLANSKWEEIRYNGPISSPDPAVDAKLKELYEHSLPDATVRELEINTDTGILAVGTYGRGVWEVQIRPLVTGAVFVDANGNGIRDFLDADGDGKRDQGEAYTEAGKDAIQVVARTGTPTGPEEASRITRSDGNFLGFYEFRNLPDDIYYIGADVDPNLYQTTSPNPLLVAEIDPVTKAPRPITRTSQFVEQNIGLFERTYIEGVKFEDTDGDGTRDLGEPGLAGWTIELVNSETGQVVLDDAGQPRRVVTGPGGAYRFNNVGVIQVPDPTPNQPNRRRVVPYTVREVLQPGWIQTRAAGGAITLTSGTPSTGNDFGNFRVFSIVGVKYEDLNGNGVREPGEPGLGGWTFELLDAATNKLVLLNGVQPVVRSDPNGVYQFVNLPPRDANNNLLTYRVRELDPTGTGWEQTSPQPGPVAPRSGQVLPGGDFGNFQLVTVSGAVFDDTDGDGLHDPDETTPIGGGTVRLFNAQAGYSKTAVVQPDGTWSIAGVRPITVNGQLVPFSVEITPQPGYIRTTALPPAFTITSGRPVTGLEFGLFRATSISGHLFHDLNGNGAQDADEPIGLGVGGAVIELINGNTGQVVTSQPVGPDGLFTFANLAPVYNPGTTTPYRVRMNRPSGWVLTSPVLGPSGESANYQLQSGVPVGPVVFGAFRLTSISGQVFSDLNGDGVRQPNEAGGVPGALVSLKDSRDGRAINSVTVGSDGRYTFADLGPLLANNVNSPYRVEVAAPAGWVTTGPTATEAVLRSGTPVEDRDFSGFKLFTVSGRVFDDRTANRVLDPTDPGLAGWQVQLRNLTTGVGITATTDKNGAYSFPNLGPGVYQVREVVQPDWVQLTPDPADIAGVSGANVPNQLFGNFRLAALSGRVVEDLNRDGVLDPAEPGRAGFVVELLDATGRVIDSRTSGPDGTYGFAALGPGTYAVRLVNQPSFLRTTPDPVPVTVTSGANLGNRDFGVLRLGSIRSFVFSDNNRNARQDAREGRLGNVQVFLRDARDVVVREGVTNANGEFEFVDLEPGNYKIHFLFGPAGSGFIFSNPANPYGIPVTITSGLGTAGNDVRLGLGIASTPVVVAGADKGGGPHVQVFDALTSAQKTSFFAYDPAFTGGVRVAQGDLTGDGVADYITVVGPGGGPDVRAFDGVTGGLLFSFFAYEESFTGGMFVAAGDVSGDGIADIITGTDIGGGPRVQVFDGVTRAPIRNYFAYESSFRGGVRVAAGDVNGDGVIDIVTTPAEGGGPRVTAFDGRNLNVLANFFAFDPTDRAGVYVAAGDFTGDDVAEILVGQGATTNPLVRVFSGSGVQLSTAQAFPPDEFGNTFKSEVRVSVTDRLGDGKLDAVVTSGPGSITRLRFLDRDLIPSADELRPYTPTFTGGVYVG